MTTKFYDVTYEGENVHMIEAGTDLEAIEFAEALGDDPRFGKIESIFEIDDQFNRIRQIF